MRQPVDLIFRAREAWSAVAGFAGSFIPGEVRVVVTQDVPIAPKGWAGIVSIGDACLVMAPDDRAAAAVSARSAGAPAAGLPLIDWSNQGHVLGPAALFFGQQERVIADGVEHLVADDPRLHQLLAGVSEDDAAESAIAEVTSGVFAVVRGGRVVSASGYRRWPGGLAHISVLTDPHWRNRGHARQVASAAIRAAADEALLPQWRARPVASQRLAQACGLIRLGTQVSLRLNPADPA